MPVRKEEKKWLLLFLHTATFNAKNGGASCFQKWWLGKESEVHFKSEMTISGFTGARLCIYDIESIRVRLTSRLPSLRNYFIFLRIILPKNILCEHDCLKKRIDTFCVEACWVQKSLLIIVASSGRYILIISLGSNWYLTESKCSTSCECT